MFNKIYDEILKIIKNNYLFIIFFFIGFAIANIKLPIYINAPGGISDVSEKIEIKDYTIDKNTFHMAYVYEFQATIPTLIYSYFNNNWDLIKKEEVIYENETKEETEFRNKMLLNEANQTAIIVSFNKANKEVNVKNKRFFVTYIDKMAKTDLKIKDEILKINNQEIRELEDIKEISKNFVAGEEITIQVKRDDKILERKATIIEIEEQLVIGILISVDQEIETNPEVNFNFKKSESGPSGGFMISLALYDALTGGNLGNGKKIAGTGTIDIYGNVGEIGGAKYKLKGAVKDKVDIFFVPAGENYNEVMEVKKEKNYDITVVPIKTLDDAIEYLKNL